MNRPVHFEIHAEDLARASHFYAELFWRTFTKREGGDTEYMMIVTWEGDVGINGWMVKRIGNNPTQHDPVKWSVFTVNVASVDEMIEKAQSLGAIVALPKQAIPTMGRLAYLIDTEKNIFGIMQSDPQAA